MGLVLLAVLVAAGAVLAAFPSRTRVPVGCVVALAGLAVFAIRLQSEVPAFPAGGNLLAGVVGLAVGIALLVPWSAGRLASGGRRALLAVAPVLLFFPLYSTLAEVEEVVVLRAPDASGEVASLRLWIVDHEGAEWVTMPRWKADAHGLDDARVELLRRGEARCVVAERREQYEQVDAIFQKRTGKYAVQRLAQALGIYGDSVGENTVTLRLTPCPAS